MRTETVARDVILVCAVSIALGLVRLGAPSLWIDEAFTARAVRLSFADLMTGQLHWLYYTLEKPWTALAGTSEWALRVPSVLGAAVACGLLVVLARRFFDAPTALASGLFLAANAFVVKWSQQARGYTLVLAMSVLAMILLFRAFDRGTRRAWAAYGLVFAAVFVWNPVSGLVLIPAHAAVLVRWRARFLPHGLLAVVPVLVLAGPWVGQIALRTSGEDSGTAWITFPTLGTTLRALADISGAVGLGVVLGVAGVWALARSGRRELAGWLGIWAFSPFLVALGISLLRPVYIDRYLIVAAPAFAMLAGVALMGMAARMRPALVLASITVVTLALFQWYTLGERGNWRGEDWRGAVRTVLAERERGAPIVVAPWWAHAGAEYYRAEVVGVSSAGSIWVLRWHEGDEPFAQAERRSLGFGDHELVEQIAFGRRLSLERWEREAGSTLP